MKIVGFSDFHLGTGKASAAAETKLLADFSSIINDIQPDLVIDAGDSVSKDKTIREPARKMAVWQQYAAFMANLPCPAVSCCLTRERSFFADLFKRPEDFCFVKSGIVIFMLAPREADDHAMTAEQLAWLTENISRHHGKAMIFAAHVPLAGTSAAGNIPPRMYLHDSSCIKKLIRRHAAAALFLGGHFHTLAEPPQAEGNMLLMMAGCISLKQPPVTYYYRIIDFIAETITVRTRNLLNRDILPVFHYTYRSGKNINPVLQ